MKCIYIYHCFLIKWIVFEELHLYVHVIFIKVNIEISKQVNVEFYYFDCQMIIANLFGHNCKLYRFHFILVTFYLKNVSTFTTVF